MKKKKKQISKKKQVFINENLMNIDALVHLLIEASESVLENELISFIDNLNERSIVDEEIAEIIRLLSSNIIPPNKTKLIQNNIKKLTKFIPKLEILKDNPKVKTEYQKIIISAINKIKEQKPSGDIEDPIETSKYQLLQYYWEKMFSAYESYSNSKEELNKKSKEISSKEDLENLNKLKKELSELTVLTDKHYESFDNLLTSLKLTKDCENFDRKDSAKCKKVIDDKAAEKRKEVIGIVFPLLGKPIPKTKEPAPSPIAIFRPGASEPLVITPPKEAGGLPEPRVTGSGSRAAAVAEKLRARLGPSRGEPPTGGNTSDNRARRYADYLRGRAPTVQGIAAELQESLKLKTLSLKEAMGKEYD